MYVMGVIFKIESYHWVRLRCRLCSAGCVIDTSEGGVTGDLEGALHDKLSALSSSKLVISRSSIKRKYLDSSTTS